MKTNGYRISAMMLAGMLTAGTLFGCGGSNEAVGSAAVHRDDNTQTITLITKQRNMDYWRMVEAGAEHAGEDLGVNVVVQGPSLEANIQEQLDQINAAIENGTDGIVVAMIDEEMLAPSLSDARASGIPVVAVDSPAEQEESADTYVGTNNYEAGKALGEYVAEQQPDAVYAIVRGAKNSVVHDEREQGIREALDAAGAKCAGSLTANSNMLEAVEQLEQTELLVNRTDLTTIVVTSDDMELGVYQAVESAGLSDQIQIYGFDGATNGLEAIMDGRIKADCAQMPMDMGYKSVALCIDLMNGESVEKEYNTGYQIVEKSDAEELYNNLKDRMNAVGYD